MEYPFYDDNFLPLRDLPDYHGFGFTVETARTHCRKRGACMGKSVRLPAWQGMERFWELQVSLDAPFRNHDYALHNFRIRFQSAGKILNKILKQKYSHVYYHIKLSYGKRLC